MFHFRIHYLFFPLIACILSACGPDKHAESIITEAEQLLNSKPDSALVVLEEIRDSKADWPHSQQMHYELVYAQAQNKAYVNFTTDSIVLSLVDYYGRHGNANEQMMANYIMGCAYRDLGSAPKALESYRNAAEKADTTDSECDFRQLMLIHSQMANVYGELYSAGYEELEYDNALRLAIKIQDHSSMDIFENLKCQVLQKYNKFQECIRLTDSLREAYIQRGNFYRANSVCVYGFKSYLALGKYDSAHVYLENYAKIFNTDVSVRNIRGGKDALY